jgi:hypothetical protein
MPVVTSEDIETLLDEWWNAKEEISLLKTKIEKYKKLATKIMKKRDVNSLASSSLQLRRKTQKTSRMLKGNVPTPVWDQYAVRTSHKAFYLTRRTI